MCVELSFPLTMNDQCFLWLSSLKGANGTLSLLHNISNRNRNIKTSKALLKSQAHKSTSLFKSAATNQRDFPIGGQEKLRYSSQTSTTTRTKQSGLKTVLNKIMVKRFSNILWLLIYVVLILTLPYPTSLSLD